MFKKHAIFYIALSYSVLVQASCPSTNPWSTAVNVSLSGGLINSTPYVAGTSTGFMIVWTTSGGGTGSAVASFSANGTSWSNPVTIIDHTSGNAPFRTDVTVAGNDTGFLSAWVDSFGNAWSSFSADNGQTWSSINLIASNIVSATNISISGSASGFVAAFIDTSSNAWVTFSDGTSTWSSPVQITSDGSVSTAKGNSLGNGYASVAVRGSTCMVTWTSTNDSNPYSAFFSAINPLTPSSSPTLVRISDFGNATLPTTVAATSAGFMAIYLDGPDQPSTSPVYSAFSSDNGTTWVNTEVFTEKFSFPWISGNGAGFMATWIDDGLRSGVRASPFWIFNNGTGWMDTICSILPSVSTTVFGPVITAGSNAGFVATWFDGNDSNIYASFTNQFVPAPTSTSSNPFVNLLQQKYGPLL